MTMKRTSYWINESVKDKPFEEFYKLREQIGEGGFSTVYRCVHKATGRPWAVKKIYKFERLSKKTSDAQHIIYGCMCCMKVVSADSSKIKRKVVAKEIEILLKLNHPNVIRLIEVFETEMEIDLVIELATGGELFHRLETQDFYSEQDASRCARMIITGVQYLHENKVLHRDLKPENLLFEADALDSNIKIADFGLAKILDPNIQERTSCGTPGYCAPEIIKEKKYSFPVDMWSIGVIIYILLSGYEPFYADNDWDIYRRTIKNDYNFNSPQWDDVSKDAKDLIRKLLVTNPQKRLTAFQALRHPWVMGITAKSETKERTLSSIKLFNYRRTMKTGKKSKYTESEEKENSKDLSKK